MSTVSIREQLAQAKTHREPQEIATRTDSRQDAQATAGAEDPKTANATNERQEKHQYEVTSHQKGPGAQLDATTKKQRERTSPAADLRRQEATSRCVRDQHKGTQGGTEEEGHSQQTEDLETAPLQAPKKIQKTTGAQAKHSRSKNPKDTNWRLTKMASPQLKSAGWRGQRTKKADIPGKTM